MLKWDATPYQSYHGPVLRITGTDQSLGIHITREIPATPRPYYVHNSDYTKAMQSIQHEYDYMAEGITVC